LRFEVVREVPKYCGEVVPGAGRTSRATGCLVLSAQGVCLGGAEVVGNSAPGDLFVLADHHLAAPLGGQVRVSRG